MFVHHKGATLIPSARRESVPAFQSHAIVHTQHLPCHSPVPWLHRLSFTHHHPTFSAKISCGQGNGIRPHGSGRIGGLGLPGRALLAPGATCPKIQLPCLVTGSGRASPGLSFLVTHKTNNPYLQDERSATRSGADAALRRGLCAVRTTLADALPVLLPAAARSISLARAQLEPHTNCCCLLVKKKPPWLFLAARRLPGSCRCSRCWPNGALHSRQ